MTSYSTRKKTGVARIKSIYYGMKNRCLNPHTPQYKYYGAKGIKLCDEWLGKGGAQHFTDWALMNGYADNLTIDRINSSKDYCPENCRWITVSENSSRAQRPKKIVERRNSMKLAYPIVLIEEVEGYTVFIPDFEINTQGQDLTEAIEMARDAIGLMGIDFEDDGKELPVPSSVLEIERNSNEIVTLVDVDFAEYRRKNDLRSVKKNCTIPSWLNYEAEKAGINFSAILQAALKLELNISER